MREKKTRILPALIISIFAVALLAACANKVRCKYVHEGVLPNNSNIPVFIYQEEKAVESCPSEINKYGLVYKYTGYRDINK